MKNLLQPVSRVTSIVFHPLLVPTWGFLLLSGSGFYFALLPWTVKRVLLLIVFLFTCLLPALSIWLLSLSPRFDLKMGKSTDRIMPLLMSSIFYYSGYLVLERMPLFPIFNLFLIASILVQITLVILSLRWKISAHAAAMGGLIGGFMAISFRVQQYSLPMLAVLIVVAGLVGSARLILLKHSSWEVYTGFTLGFLIMNLLITFI